MAEYRTAAPGGTTCWTPARTRAGSRTWNATSRPATARTERVRNEGGGLGLRHPDGVRLIVTPIYWIMSEDPTGTTALVMTFFLSLLVAFYLSITAAGWTPGGGPQEAEIVDGAGELGFFPPYSWWRCGAPPRSR